MSGGENRGEKPRIGVYVCHCGSNIAKTVKVSEVVAAARQWPDVTVAREYPFMCSDPGQEIIQSDIEEHDLDRVVVAACSPLMHENTFRQAVETSGLNRYLFEMANIREQVSWVTIDSRAATEKATALVRAAVWRVRFHDPLEMRKVGIKQKVLIVGAGIAGIEAALQIADAGYKVLLVEREPSIGGHMARFDKTFPTLDCAACILTPKMVSAGRHPNITLLTHTEVEEVDGYIGNFTVKLRKKARYVDTELCNSCGSCYEACPSSPLPGNRRLMLGDQVVHKGPALKIRNPELLGSDTDLTVLTGAQPRPEPELCPAPEVPS